MTTNYTDTFIHVASDSPAEEAQAPPAGRAEPSVAQLQYELLIDAPYALTSDDVIFAVHAIRRDIADEDRAEARLEFFAKPQACLRSSPLAKRYGWGIHHDSQCRIALVPVGSEDYKRLSEAPALRKVEALRSKRR
ncbi:DUF6157 family protein [Saxibacter everestensis]|uniref:DUF6157 family protein n=1 Tax=Saxibacter everestensis TaxID=2909229 RepID=A0ABY8R0L1_9MICO|nr:DUF6157 family protein [Brevibacteriaceae bacterium ZFBP1038]